MLYRSYFSLNSPFPPSCTVWKELMLLLAEQLFLPCSHSLRERNKLCKSSCWQLKWLLVHSQWVWLHHTVMNVTVSGMVLSKHHFTTRQCRELDKRNPSTWGRVLPKQAGMMDVVPMQGETVCKAEQCWTWASILSLIWGAKKQICSWEKLFTFFFIFLTICEVWELGPDPMSKVVMFSHSGDFTCFKARARHWCLR